MRNSVNLRGKTLSQIEITPKPGETGAQRRQRALKEQRARRKIVNQALKHHKAAMAVRNRFVKCNLRLVVSVARRFHHHQMPLIDLIQEGNLGLLKVFIASTPRRFSIQHLRTLVDQTVD